MWLLVHKYFGNWLLSIIARAIPNSVRHDLSATAFMKGEYGAVSSWRIWFSFSNRRKSFDKYSPPLSLRIVVTSPEGNTSLWNDKHLTFPHGEISAKNLFVASAASSFVFKVAVYPWYMLFLFTKYTSLLPVIRDFWPADGLRTLDSSSWRF